jgi:predicted AlkP superfamily phosphohydrolase/phosphomutase
LRNSKVIVIGLDGATWNIIKPLINKGRLPTIGKLLKEGTTSNLESSIPHVTFPAWKCYSTGKNPGKLGVFWWLNIDKTSKKVRVNDSRSFKSKEIWDYLSYCNISVGIIGMPTTYPPKKVNGFMISEFNPLNAEFTYPRALKQDLKINLGYNNEFIDYHGGNADAVLKHNMELINQRFEAANYLMEKYNPKFFNLTIFHIDAMQHFFWKFMEKRDRKYGSAIEESWKLIDRNIARLLREHTDNNTYIFLMSEHGFTSLKAIFNINKWLINRGYLVLNKDIGLKPLLYRIATIIGIRGSFIEKLKKISFLKSILGDSSSILSDSTEHLIDWEKSKVIPTGGGLLYINLATSEDYGEFRKKLINEIKSISNPSSGESLAKEIYQREKLYTGQYIENAPDIVILPNEGYEIKSSFIGDLWEFIPKEEGWSGVHKLHGIFLAHGQNIKKGIKLKGVKIYDIAPTILHIFGIPIPDEMDGRVLTEIFEEDSEPAKRKPIYVDSSYYEEMSERKKLKAKIKNLKLKKRL